MFVKHLPRANSLFAACYHVVSSVSFFIIAPRVFVSLKLRSFKSAYDIIFHIQRVDAIVAGDLSLTVDQKFRGKIPSHVFAVSVYIVLLQKRPHRVRVGAVDVAKLCEGKLDTVPFDKVQNFLRRFSLLAAELTAWETNHLETRFMVFAVQICQLPVIALRRPSV